jgi:hypothetical protein
MSIQPGDGYNFSASSSGFTLDINKPWTPSADGGLLFGLNIPPFPDIPFPPLPDWPGTNENPQQFQVETFMILDKQYIRIAGGAVTYTQSNMPEVWKGATTDTRQAWIYKTAVRPGVTVVNGGNPNSAWMEDGGYYELPSSGQYYVTISKLDINDQITESPLLAENVPFVSIFSADDPLYEIIFSETGPSLYVNQTNVQKMSGYDAESTGLSGDWGNCHTTWFNPVKWGYSVKLIAIVNAEVPAITEPFVEQIQAATATANEVHRVTLPEVKNLKTSGSLQLQYAPGFTSDTTDPFDPFNPLNSGNVSYQMQGSLMGALKGIQSLRGNTSVAAAAPNKLDITYLNNLANTAVALPTVINSTLDVATTCYNVDQQVIGSIDLSIPVLYNGSTLMNVPDWVESEDDPYNENEANEWNDICNYLQRDSLETVTASALDYYEIMVGPAEWATTNPSYLKVGSCDGDEPTSDHPFKVIYEGESEEDGDTYTIVSGTVNNLVPQNIDVTLGVTGVCQVWIQMPATAGDYFPTNNADFKWEIGPTMPDDTDNFGYVRIAEVHGSEVTQFITGSLWGDRIKLGTQTATYYYARV